MLPQPRGPLSAMTFAALRDYDTVDPTVRSDSGEDAQITLWTLYQLHYRGFTEVPDDREWDPDLLRLRVQLEEAFENTLRSRWAAHDPQDVPLERLIQDQSGPSLARFVQREATREQVLELLRHRTLYHLKEADPTSWVVPRLGTRSKAAVMEIQYDEYGGGNPNRLHHHLFQRGLAASGLRSEPPGYVDEAPLEVLESNNAMSLFGLHRRLRGATLGHLAAFEATSTVPSRQLAQGLRRLEFPDEMVAYYDEHVIADAVHEQLALRDVCGAFIEEEPDEAEQVRFGAFTCLDLEARYARRMLDRWVEVDQECA